MRSKPAGDSPEPRIKEIRKAGPDVRKIRRFPRWSQRIATTMNRNGGRVTGLTAAACLVTDGGFRGLERRCRAVITPSPHRDCRPDQYRFSFKLTIPAPLPLRPKTGSETFFPLLGALSIPLVITAWHCFRDA